MKNYPNFTFRNPNPTFKFKAKFKTDLFANVKKMHLNSWFQSATPFFFGCLPLSPTTILPPLSSPSLILPSHLAYEPPSPHLLYPLILPSITLFPLCSFILHPQPPLSFSSQLSERVPILRSWQHSLDRNQPPWGIWTVERCVTGTCQKLCDSLWVFHRGSLMGCTLCVSCGCMCVVLLHQAEQRICAGLEKQIFFLSFFYSNKCVKIKRPN